MKLSHPIVTLLLIFSATALYAAEEKKDIIRKRANQELLAHCITDDMKMLVQRLEQHDDENEKVLIINNPSHGTTVLHTLLEAYPTIPYETLKAKIECLLQHGAWPLIPIEGETPYALLQDKDRFPNEDHRAELEQLLDSVLESDDENDQDDRGYHSC